MYTQLKGHKSSATNELSFPSSYHFCELWKNKYKLHTWIIII